MTAGVKKAPFQDCANHFALGGGLSQGNQLVIRGGVYRDNILVPVQDHTLEADRQADGRAGIDPFTQGGQVQCRQTLCAHQTCQVFDQSVVIQWWPPFRRPDQ